MHADLRIELGHVPAPGHAMTPSQQQTDSASTSEGLTLPALAAEIRTLRDEHEQVRDRLSEIERRAFRSTQTPNGFDMLEALQKVESMTRQIFSGEVTMEEREDPEIPNDRHFAFCVVDTGNIEDILARHNEWHARLDEVPVELRGMFCLSIDAR
ncbi:MAG: hypothetical protein HY000_28205 [Planctomycetes bacterium]|nr:hypothetical protein [Planctomycetota bacterium]